MAACLERLTSPAHIDDYFSAVLGRRVRASKTTRFASFPPYLSVALKRYYVGEGWVPKKLDVLVDVSMRVWRGRRSGGATRLGGEEAGRVGG
eukprot:259293-Chlamydomonas_euryale.AAC.3